MEKIFIAHQAHFFVDNRDIEAKSLMMKSLTEALEHLELIPTMGSEMNTVTGEKRQYPIMITSDEAIQVQFLINDIYVSSSKGSFDEFFDLSMSIYSALSKIFPMKQATRLSLLTSTSYEDSENNSYVDLYQKLFKDDSVDIFEWDCRKATKAAMKDDERANVISHVLRGEMYQAQNVSNSKDLISLNFDANTEPQKNNPRFDLLESQKVYLELKDLLETAKSIQENIVFGG
ncbi:TPA: hypothetical protein ACX6RC_001987 [Photobacterium damselae]